MINGREVFDSLTMAVLSLLVISLMFNLKVGIVIFFMVFFTGVIYFKLKQVEKDIKSVGTELYNIRNELDKLHKNGKKNK